MTALDISEKSSTNRYALGQPLGGSAAVLVLQITEVQSLVNQHEPPLASRAGKAVWRGTLCWVSGD